MQTYNPTLLEKGIRALFLQEIAAFERVSLVDRIATVVQSGANNEKYAWIGQPPQMSEITDTADAINFSSMSDTSYTITNKKFASGIAVSRDQLSDDQIGGVQMRVRQLAETAVRHKNKLLIDALINGTSSTLGLCYDGVSFFNDSHPARKDEGGTQDNLLAGAGVTTANLQTDIAQCIHVMGRFKAENGEPFHEDLSQLVMVCPWQIRQPVLEALQMNLFPDRTSAQLEGLNITPIFSARLSDANDWYMLNVGGAVKPLIFQDREPLEFAGLERDSDTGFIREQYLYKVRARYAVGYSFWQHATKIVNT